MRNPRPVQNLRHNGIGYTEYQRRMEEMTRVHLFRSFPQSYLLVLPQSSRHEPLRHSKPLGEKQVSLQECYHMAGLSQALWCDPRPPFVDLGNQRQWFDSPTLVRNGLLRLGRIILERTVLDLQRMVKRKRFPCSSKQIQKTMQNNRLQGLKRLIHTPSSLHKLRLHRLSLIATREFHTCRKFFLQPIMNSVAAL